MQKLYIPLETFLWTGQGSRAYIIVIADIK